MSRPVLDDCYFDLGGFGFELFPWLGLRLQCRYSWGLEAGCSSVLLGELVRRLRFLLGYLHWIGEGWCIREALQIHLVQRWKL